MRSAHEPMPALLQDVETNRAYECQGGEEEWKQVGCCCEGVIVPGPRSVRGKVIVGWLVAYPAATAAREMRTRPGCEDRKQVQGNSLTSLRSANEERPRDHSDGFAATALLRPVRRRMRAKTTASMMIGLTHRQPCAGAAVSKMEMAALSAKEQLRCSTMRPPPPCYGRSFS